MSVYSLLNSPWQQTHVQYFSLHPQATKTQMAIVNSSGHLTKHSTNTDKLVVYPLLVELYLALVPISWISSKDVSYGMASIPKAINITDPNPRVVNFLSFIPYGTSLLSLHASCSMSKQFICFTINPVPTCASLLVAPCSKVLEHIHSPIPVEKSGNLFSPL